MNEKIAVTILMFCYILFYPLTKCYSDSDISFSLKGAVELETFLNTYEDQELKDAIKKEELRGRFLVNYGLDNIYLFSAVNAYTLPRYYLTDDENTYRYAEETTVFRNLQISGTTSEIAFNELYLNYTASKYRLRIGNQIYGWGTADTFNPTAYFNPMDIRELVLRDMDEMTTGIPSVSSMIFMDGYTLELVFAPIHIPAQVPFQENFWSPQLNQDIYSITIEQGNNLDISLENAGIGARLSTNLFEADMSFSLFHGPNKDGVLVPSRTKLFPNEPVVVIIEPQYYIVNKVGVDFSKTFGPVAIMCEAAYSNDTPALVKPDLDNYEDISFPMHVKKTQCFSANIGFNYFVPLTNISFFEFHEGESLFLCEYASTTYFDDNVMDAYLADLISIGYRDTFYGGRIPLTLLAIFDANTGSSVLWPQIGYDFQNGFTIALSYVMISGKAVEDDITQPVFYYYRDNDVVTMKLRYEF